MKKPNVLILDAGGPCGIAVIKLLKKNEIANIVAADINKYCPAFPLADKAIIVSPHKAGKFLDEINKILIKEKIDIVLPCFHYGVEKLEKIADKRFIFDFKAAALCRDKYQFAKECLRTGLPSPLTEKLEDVVSITKSVHIKPRFGVGSRSCFKIENNLEYQSIRQYLLQNDDFIVQDLLIGQQWTVDVLVLRGKFINALTRKDLIMKAGNTVTAEIKNNHELELLAFDVYKRLNIKSPFNLEVINTDRGFQIVEVNPRFGSGIIFTALAGCDTVSYIVSGDKKYLGHLREGIYSRYYEEIQVPLPK